MALSAVRPKDLVALAAGQVALAGIVLFAYGLRWYTALGALVSVVVAIRYLRAAKRRPVGGRDPRA